MRRKKPPNYPKKNFFSYSKSNCEDDLGQTWISNKSYPSSSRHVIKSRVIKIKKESFPTAKESLLPHGFSRKFFVKNSSDVYKFINESRYYHIE